MDDHGPRPRRPIKDALRPLRDRIVDRLGGTIPGAPTRGVTYEELVHLLYPTLPDDLRARVDEAAAGELTDVSTIRRMLGTIEHQRAPTAFSVQLTENDAVPCTVGDVELLCDAADAAVTPGLRSGEYEPHLTAVFERYCTPGTTVVDVGANLGYYSLLAARLVGPRGQVIALEPNSENCRLLLSSLRRSGLGNVQVLPVAADVQTGWAYYSTHVGSNGGLIDDEDLLTRPGVVVPTFRLDDLVAGPVGLLKTAGPVGLLKTAGPVGLLKTAGPVGLLKTAGPVGLLKMDVEGAEGRVVRGATRLIERDRPIVTTELKEEMLTRVSNTRVGEYLSYFEDLGYTAALLEKETGAEKRYASVADLLADWGGRDELRDVLLLPATR